LAAFRAREYLVAAGVKPAIGDPNDAERIQVEQIQKFNAAIQVMSSLRAGLLYYC